MLVRLCGLIGATVVLAGASTLSWGQDWGRIGGVGADPAADAIFECFEHDPPPAHCRALLRGDLNGGAPGPLLLHCYQTSPTPEYCLALPGFEPPAEDRVIPMAWRLGVGRPTLKSCFWIDPMPAICYEILGMEAPRDIPIAFPGERFPPPIVDGPPIDPSCWYTDPTPQRCLGLEDEHAPILTTEGMALQEALEDEFGIPRWCLWTDPMPLVCILMMTRRDESGALGGPPAPTNDEVIGDWSRCLWIDPPPLSCEEAILDWWCVARATQCHPVTEEPRVRWGVEYHVADKPPSGPAETSPGDQPIVDMVIDDAEAEAIDQIMKSISKETAEEIGVFTSYYALIVAAGEARRRNDSSIFWRAAFDFAVDLTGRVGVFGRLLIRPVRLGNGTRCGNDLNCVRGRNDLSRTYRLLERDLADGEIRGPTGHEHPFLYETLTGEEHDRGPTFGLSIDYLVFPEPDFGSDVAPTPREQPPETPAPDAPQELPPAGPVELGPIG